MMPLKNNYKWSWEQYEGQTYNQKYYQKNKESILAYGKQWYQDNKEYSSQRNKKYIEGHKERLNKLKRERNKKAWGDFNDPYWFKRRCSAIKTRAKSFNLDFDLDPEYLKSIFPKDKKCPALGLPFIIGSRYVKGKEKHQTVSLDRINSNKGYIKGNVQWVSFLANTIMTNATPDQVIKVGKHFKKILENNNEETL